MGSIVLQRKMEAQFYRFCVKAVYQIALLLSSVEHLHRLKDGQSRLLTSTIGVTFVHSLLSETAEAFPCRIVIVSGSGVLSLLKAADKNGLVKGRCVVLDGNERIIQRVIVKIRKHLKSALIQ